MEPSAEGPPLRLGRRPALDGLRGVAVLAVLAGHGGLAPGWGWIGVDIFFALSGFLITALLCEEWDDSGRIGLRRFYVRRARRLLPALCVLLAGFTVCRVVFGLFPAAGWPVGQHLAVVASGAANWTLATVDGAELGPLTPAWSLAQEEQFYLFWPLVLFAMLRLRCRPSATVTVVGALAAALFVVVPLTPAAAWTGAYGGYYSPFDRAGELVIGAGAALVWRHRLVPAMVTGRWAGWAVVGAAPVLYLALAPPITLRAKLLWLSSLTALLILSLLTCPGGFLSRLLSTAFLRWTGRISYGLYLYHLPLLWLIGPLVPEPAVWQRTLLLAACSYLCAALSWHCLESRFLFNSPKGSLSWLTEKSPPPQPSVPR
ncbi:acyltransferase family protein [Streptomyces sp. NPDC000888]